jgi:4-amino-4-deoxy-L-arabinose transferase-like glycosyltransferase
MLRGKDLAVLYWNQSVYLDKPPMFIWASAISSLIFGLSEFSVRLPSALCALFVAVILLVYTKKKFGYIPSLVALGTLVLNNVFIWRARSGNIDLLVTFFIFLTYFILISTKKYKYFFLGVLFACIYLTKASLVALPLLIFIISEIAYERQNIKKNILNYVFLFVIFFGLAGIWLLFGYMKAGRPFVDYYLFHSDQGVASMQLSFISADYLNHMYYALQRRFFWIFLFGAGWLVVHIKKKENLLLLLYSMLLLLQLSFTQRDNNWYLLPSMPFWSIVIAYGTDKIFKLFRYNKIVVSIFACIGFYLMYRTLIVNILPILNTSATVAQAESSKVLNRLSSSKEIIVRLDHLYPTTIYYSDRKTLASPEGINTNGFFISRHDLKKKLSDKEIRWLIGKKDDTNKFLGELEGVRVRRVSVNRDEEIIEVL